mgnify:CR=1 FL=1
MQDIFEKLRQYLLDNRIIGEVDWDEKTFEITIHNGDWKHDHWRCDYLVEEFAKRNDIAFIQEDVVVTEDNGSDCYSATHIYKII